MADSDVMTNRELEDLNGGVCLVLGAVIASLPEEQRQPIERLLRTFVEQMPGAYAVTAELVLANTAAMDGLRKSAAALANN